MSEGDKARGINILCIDGGGVRGLSSLALLGEIMGRLGELEGRYERPDPAEYFDVIAGTGTGGISACMLGRMRMPLGQSISAYVGLLSEVFSDKKNSWTSTASTYKGTKLQEALKALVKNATGNQDDRMKDTTEVNKCKTMIFAMSKHNLNAGIPVMFRSYESTVNPAPDCAIWEALYATMAHPDLFKSIDISDGVIKQSFVGGELGCSNPINHVLAEVRRLYPDRHVSCILSIGAGHARTISLPGPGLPQTLLSIKQATAIMNMATDSERVAEEIEARFQDTIGVYYRFNVDQGMQNMNADDWEKLGEVMAHTRAYFSKVEPNRRIGQAAGAIQERKAAISVKQLDGRVQVSSSEQVAHVKHFPAPSSKFTGREDQIRQVGACITGSNDERRVCVVYGLGGAGKTQLALKTIERHQDSWAHTLFVDASSKETVESTLQDIARAKDVGKTHEDTLRWLSVCRETWVLLYDNADSPLLDIHEYFPGGNRSSILITTRLADMVVHARGPGSECQISEMSQEDALALLLTMARMERRRVAASEMEAATALLEDFGYFALAIVQAGAYIGYSKMSIFEYRKRFLSCRRSALDQYKKVKVKVDGYQWSVFTTWKLCYDLLGEGSQSRLLLWLIAFLHHDHITANIFERGAINIKKYKPLLPRTDLEVESHQYVQEFLSKFEDESGVWDASLFSDAISELAAYSLVEYDPVNAGYKIHVLVQEWARTLVLQSPDLALECTTTLLSHAVDQGDTIMAHRSRLSLGLHVIKVLSERHDAVSANHAPHFAKVYQTMGLWDRQEVLELLTKNTRERVHGPEHQATLGSMGDLASTYWNKGRWDDAEQLQLKVLEAYTRTLGSDHPDTLSSTNNLAMTYLRKGRWDNAEQLHVKVLEARRRMLGEDHPGTLTSMNNLAMTYSNKGRWDDAEQLQVRVLRAHTQKLGDNHPDTLRSMNNLATTYSRMGRWNDAEELQLKALQAYTWTLGNSHPDTLTSMNNLATTYSNKGRWGDAEQLELKVLETHTRTLGEGHPDTLRSMTNLASTYSYKGRWDDAEQLELKVLEARTRMLDEDHPDTLTSMSNLASIYSNMGRWDDAERLQLKVLQAHTRTLGEGNPETLASMSHLAMTYLNNGRLDEAEQLQIKVLQAHTSTLGNNHLDTLTSMSNLAMTYLNKGQWDDAEQLNITVLEARTHTLGNNHPDTLASMNNLALTLWNMGRWDQAEQLLVQVVEARARIIGDQHPSTVLSRGCLTLIQQSRSQRS